MDKLASEVTMEVPVLMMDKAFKNKKGRYSEHGLASLLFTRVAAEGSGCEAAPADHSNPGIRV